MLGSYQRVVQAMGNENHKPELFNDTQFSIINSSLEESFDTICDLDPSLAHTLLGALDRINQIKEQADFREQKEAIAGQMLGAVRAVYGKDNSTLETVMIRLRKMLVKPKAFLQDDLKITTLQSTPISNEQVQAFLELYLGKLKDSQDKVIVNSSGRNPFSSIPDTTKHKQDPTNPTPKSGPNIAACK